MAGVRQIACKVAITSRTNQDKQGGSTLNSVQSEQNTITVLRITCKTRGKRAGNTTGHERARAKRSPCHILFDKTRGKRAGNTTGNERARPKRGQQGGSTSYSEQNVSGHQRTTDSRLVFKPKTTPITKLRACVRAKRNDFLVLGHVGYPPTSDIPIRQAEA